MPNRQISEVISEREVLTAGGATTVCKIAKIMQNHHSSAVLIVDKGVLTGICAERDIVHKVVAAGLDPGKTRADAIMCRKIQCISPEKPFGHALHLMYEGGFSHIPVVDEAGHPVGLLSAHDALDCDGLQLEQDLERREEITVIL